MRIARSFFCLLMLVTLTACTGDSDDDKAGEKTSASPSTSGITTPAPDDVTGPDAGGGELPKAGDCQSTPAEALDNGLALVSNYGKKVDCGSEHNAVTVGVVGIPTDKVGSVAALAETGQAIDPGHEQIWRSIVTPACSAAFEGAYGSAVVDVPADGVELAYKSSTLRPYIWLPTPEEWADGARWIRCDVANRAGDPIDIDKPQLDLEEIPDELVACLNANVEGYLPVPCDDALVNAQSLVSVVLDEASAEAAKQDYDTYSGTTAPQICQQAVTAAYPDAGKPAKAAMPIAFAFTGRFDCYVDHVAGEPLIK